MKLALKLLFALVACVGLSVCNNAGDATNSDGRAQYADALGFSLRHEPGWQVSSRKGAYIQVVSDDQKSRGIVFPFLAKTVMSSQNCLEQVPETFSDILASARLISSKKTKTKPDESIGEYAATSGDALALCSVDGASGVLFLAISPDGVRSKNIKTIIETFKSFSFEQPGKISSNNGPMTQWIDPLEKAFSIKVPQDFKVHGGLYRFGSVDVRIHVRITSPDDAIIIGIGDKEVPKYSSQQGAVEGSIYNPGYGNALTVKRFMSGGAFAVEYATNNAQALGCPGGQASGNELDELTRKLQEISDQSANAIIKNRISAGEARVTCQKNGQDHVGYVFANVTLTPFGNDDTGTWFADVSGYSAPRARENSAKSLAVAIYQSLQVEPAWFQAQQGTTGATAQIVAKTNNEIADIFRQSNTRTQATMDRIFRNWSNATLGQTDVVDVTTGEKYKIASGKNYYWRKAGTDIIAGTNQYERPNIDFTPLLEY